MGAAGVEEWPESDEGNASSTAVVGKKGKADEQSARRADGASSPPSAASSHDQEKDAARPAPLGVVLTHVSADFDTLSSAVGLAKLRDHRMGAACTFVVLPRGASPGVSHYVELHKNKFPIKRKKTIDLNKLEWIGVVDAQRRDRLADCASWIDVAKDVVVVDHHVLNTSDIDATELIVEKVGATATVVAEMLKAENVKITEEVATLLALGIHTDTVGIDTPLQRAATQERADGRKRRRGRLAAIRSRARVTMTFYARPRKNTMHGIKIDYIKSRCTILVAAAAAATRRAR